MITKNSTVFGGDLVNNNIFVGSEHGFIGGTEAPDKSARKSMDVRPALYIQSSASFNGDGSKENLYRLVDSRGMGTS